MRMNPSAMDLHEILKVQALELPELSSKWNIDGVLDESIWEQSARYEIELETYPALLEPSPVKTEVFISIVEEGLMIGIIAHDPEPEEIQAPLRDRDSIEFDDYVGFSVDPAGKLLTKYEFYVTASGVQGDWVRDKVDDLRTRDWDADWESAATIRNHGYRVEMRILWPSWISQSEKARSNFCFLSVTIPVQSAIILMPSPTGRWTLPKTLLKKDFVAIPSITLLNEQSRDAKNDEDWEADYKSEFGMDIGYKVTPSLDLLATYNPNFLEIEADLVDWSINDPFTKLLSERRPFFSRGVETFATPFDLVYTRNIENPDGGIKVTGFVSDLTTGNFIVDDKELSLIVPGNLSSDRADLDIESTSGAFRYRYDFGPGKSAGLIATGRTNGADYHNGVAGFDLYKRFNKENELRAQWVYSSTQYPDEIVNELCEDDDACDYPQNVPGLPGITPLNEQVFRADPNREYNDDALVIKYKYNHRKRYFIARYYDIGEDFRADLGYMNRVDYRMFALIGGLNHYMDYKDKGKVRFRPSINFLRQESQAGELINESREIWLNHWGLYQSWLRLGYRNRDRTAKRFLQNTLEIDGNSRLFTENQLEFRFEGTTMRNSRFILAGKVGTQIDTDNYRLGDIIEIKPELRWHITDHLELGLKDTYRQLDVDEGRLFTENYLGFHLIYHFIKGSFIRFTVIDDYVERNPDLYLFEVVDKLERDTSAEILFAWKPTQLNTLFFGAKFGAVDSDALEDPELEDMAFYINIKGHLRSDSKQLIKGTHLFSCSTPLDYLPIKSYPLFRARHMLKGVLDRF